jgi:hypothetical protein
MKPMLCLALALPFVLPLAGCAGPEVDYLPTGSVDRPLAPPAPLKPVVAAPLAPVVVAPAAEEGFADALMMLPPEAGAVMRVRERHFANGTRQDIVLRGDQYGENVIEVSVRTQDAVQGTGPGLLQMGPPSERGVRGEIIGRFPNMSMHIVTRPLSNALGPFGVAVGRRGDGARCAFAWQWIEDAREVWPARGGGFGRMGALFAANTPASVRIRLCRTDATVDQLVSAIEGLATGTGESLQRIVQMDRRNFVGEPGGYAPLAPEGRPVADLMPVGRTLESALGPPPSASVAAAPRPSRVGAKPAPRAKPKPQPRPQPVRAARKPAEREPERASEPPAPPAPLWGQGQPTGPRYMAPVAAAPGGAAAPSVAAPARLNPHLPAQAYRGPASGALWQGQR